MKGIDRIVEAIEIGILCIDFENRKTLREVLIDKRITHFNSYKLKNNFSLLKVKPTKVRIVPII